MFHRVKSVPQSDNNMAQASNMDPVHKSSEVQTESVEREEKRSAEGQKIESSEASLSSPASSSSSKVYKSQSYLQVSNTEKEKEEKTMADQNTATSSETEQNANSADAPGSIYQRAGSVAASTTTANYSPSYTSPYATSPSADSGENDSRLTIGRGITMSGEIESCDHLYVEGTVEAALKGARVLDIAESGVFYGTVEIENANISGRFEGDIKVTGRLTVESTGVVTGTISYGELQIESGAVIDGRLTPASVTQASETQEKSAAAPSAQATTPAPVERKAPAGGAGLFKEDRSPAPVA